MMKKMKIDTITLISFLLLIMILFSCSSGNSPVNNPPIADAGIDQEVSVLNPVILDGGGSSDPEGASLTYLWSVVSTPNNSNIILSDATVYNPSFTPDISGEYMFELIVDDGEFGSNIDTIKVTAINTPPIADAGIDQEVSVLNPVILDGSGSFDPENASITYLWEIVSKPCTSYVHLSNTSTINTDFIPDVAGEYSISLVVNDGEIESEIDVINVRVYGELIIYSNNFSSDSLNDFIDEEIGTAEILIEGGQLRINPGEGYLNRGFVALDLPGLCEDYRGRLSDNINKVIWAFNVSNFNGSVCGACNNLFAFKISSLPDSSDPAGFGYAVQGGGYVGDRLMLHRYAAANSPFGPVHEIITDLTDGLGNLPNIGAFRVEFFPDTNTWDLYFEESTEKIDPLSITNLIGSVVNDGFVDEELPYIILNSQNTGSCFFDNLTVSIEILPIGG